MDDLDHSIHIAEFDWSRFYDDSEECCLLQPSLARPDNLSDTDDPENSKSGLSADQQETQQSPHEVKGDESESISAGENSCVESSAKLKESSAEVQEEIREIVSTTTQLDTFQSPGVSQTPIKDDEHLQTQSENSGQHPHLHPSVNETLTAGRQAVSEDGRKEERERWFVTVNYTPARPRARVPSVKKKRRQKNSSKSRHTDCCRQDRFDTEESGEGRYRGEVRSCQGAESGSVLLHMSCVGDRMSEKEAVRAVEEPKAGSLAGSHEAFTPKACSQEERTEELEEVYSIHTCDSDCYFSAAESMGEAEHLLRENPELLESTKPQCQVSLLLQDVKSHHFHKPPSCDAAAAHSDRYECTNVGLAMTFPSADHKAHEIPDEFSMSDTNTSGAGLHRVSDTAIDKRNISTSVSSSKDQLSSGPDLTVTPCSKADGPEMHAEAAGQSRPVFAISDFWNEMEKLTINDILHLRMTETQESQTANVIASGTNPRSLADPVQCSTSDVGLVDLSDTADSDYFTQAEESKPDRSSCDVSTSDFEDEYWQFIHTNRSNSPEVQDKSQEGTSNFSFSLFKERNVDEVESLSSEGRGTPVPSFEDFAGQGFEDGELHTLSQLLRPGQMRKSKTMSDVRALNNNKFTDPFGESSLFFSRCQSMEEIRVLEVSDSLDTLTSAPAMSKYETDVRGEQHPELLEYFSLDNKSKMESWCLDDYSPAGLSVVPVFDHTLRDQVSFSLLLDSLCNMDKPIPIFSCPQYVRGITVPKMDYVLLRTLNKVDDFSPIRIISGLLTQTYQYGTPAAARCWPDSWRTPLSVKKFHMCDVLTEGHISAATPQVFREPAAQHHMVEIKGTAVALRGHKGVFSALKQSDMCLVCIAFASWVLTSSDPENADAWKAALLANVSALSAIQYLRHYVKKRRPLQEDHR